MVKSVGVKIIFLGDSPTVSTGFSRCTVAACDTLHAAGHEVIVLGINEKGDPRDEFPYKIYPCKQPLDGGSDEYGAGRLCVFIDRFRPDVVCILQDPFNIKPHFDALDKFFKDDPETVPPIVGWLAVDSCNQLAKPLNRLAHVAVWTFFAGRELVKGGYEGGWSIVPLGVDSNFYPRDKAASRELVGLPQDAFVVGVVGRLQTRKRIDITLEAFHCWVTRCDVPNAVLFLHAAPTGDVGCNIRALVHYYGLRGKVFLSEPHPGKGVDNDMMAAAYSAMDCYTTQSQAEGWGLPALEAMACGVACVLPDFAAFGKHGWVGNAAIRVPCPTTSLTAPMNSRPYTIGRVPDKNAVVDALQALYSSPSLRADLRQRGLLLASTLTWKKTGTMMVELLERVVAEDRERRKQGGNADVGAPTSTPELRHSTDSVLDSASTTAVTVTAPTD